MLVHDDLHLHIAGKANRQHGFIPDVLVVLEQGLVVRLHLCTRHDRRIFHQLVAFDAFNRHLGYHTECTESHLQAIRTRRGERVLQLRTHHGQNLIERTLSFKTDTSGSFHVLPRKPAMHSCHSKQCKIFHLRHAKKPRVLFVAELNRSEVRRDELHRHHLFIHWGNSSPSSVRSHLSW